MIDRSTFAAATMLERVTARGGGRAAAILSGTRVDTISRIAPAASGHDASRKIVLTTIGTMGDLHPVIALGLALKARGFRPVLAVPDDQVAKARGAGLEAVGVVPGFDAIRRRMGVPEDVATLRIMSDQRQMLKQVLLPDVSRCARALAEVAEGAAAIVASMFVFAAPLVAEKLGIPLVCMVLQPMAMLSAFDPPCTPDFWMMKKPPVGRVGGMWNRSVYGAVRAALNGAHGGRIAAVRAEQHLPKRRKALTIEPGARAAITLGCYSPIFGPLPSDAPANTSVVGFLGFDSASGAEEQLDPALARFLDAGPPPLVFTLGTFAVKAAGDFYAEAAVAGRHLKRRVVLLTGSGARPRATGDLFATGYAPHSLLFPRAAAIIHHGGAGTTGQALRAGKPQLVVPHMGDQFDNARRVARLGVGRALASGRFEAGNGARLIAMLLADAQCRATAERIGRLVAAERGAETAAALIDAELAPVG